MDSPLTTNLLKRVADDFVLALDEFIENAKKISEKIKLKATSLQKCPSHQNQNACRKVSLRVKRLNSEQRFRPATKRCVVSLKRMDMQRNVNELDGPVVACASTSSITTASSTRIKYKGKSTSTTTALSTSLKYKGKSTSTTTASSTSLKYKKNSTSMQRYRKNDELIGPVVACATKTSTTMTLSTRLSYKQNQPQPQRPYSLRRSIINK